MCDRPPKGWACRLPNGHDGPCPAWPKSSLLKRALTFHIVETWDLQRCERSPFIWGVTYAGVCFLSPLSLINTLLKALHLPLLRIVV